IAPGAHPASLSPPQAAPACTTSPSRPRCSREAQQQPPLVGGRAEGGGVLVQSRNDLISEVKRRDTADGRTLRSILRPSSGTKSSAERRTLGSKVHPTAKPSFEQTPVRNLPCPIYPICSL